MTFTKVVGSILLIAIGVLLMRYTVQVTNFTGKFGWAERYLAGGFGAGTYTFFRLLGLTFCVLAILWLFGVIDFTPAFTPETSVYQ